MSGVGDPAARSGPPPGSPRDDLQFLGIALAVLAVLLTFNAMNTYHEHVRAGHPLAPWEPAVWEVSSGLFFLAVGPIIQLLTRRAWLGDRPLLPRLAIHFVAAVAISLVHVLFIGAARWAVYRVMRARYDPLGPLGDWPYELRKDLMVYAAIVGVYTFWRLVRAKSAAGVADAWADVLEVRDGARRHFVPLAEVVWVEAAGNYVELHRGGAGLLHRASLSEMERRLHTAGFVRIHRSRLVRRQAVAAIESKPTGDFTVRLTDGRELAGSRRYRHPLLAD
ncbi:LytTR family DNA-binding domain-containing protein [Phenylobacterium sp.]|uniref:LytTR family DNA-binding domain-containing protein n=1 Tax=Phenylobacterium sp. TaxID=1871053 RepID=UPI002C79D5A8|nr:LytTR family DNA-binding domain-containing protein [Phenylobacterium sp.]HLZ77374.1 LytTR family DNA-binding domain-containing protein [Phenylobacterium sp.]